MSGKISIAFPNGNIIPASVLGTKKDVPVPAHTAIEVPEAYGRHLIDDKFAYATADDSEDGGGKASSRKKAAKEDKAAKIAAAETAVADAQGELDAAGADLAAKASVEQKLEAAKAALADLKG
ncbi:hypothetical protein QWJ46_16775 [Rhizobium sp. CBN3]|uniref:hypothetical protein n=1 Tax=Rhizobium sp. CBN3 TaxID=3058045 RepID=UPI002673FC10|nr:hypothetical protein [Rhizobium sp. CBN3]MDO3434336.1 hypothetical protein [Rhizobium sp. CBN3]